MPNCGFVPSSSGNDEGEGIVNESEHPLRHYRIGRRRTGDLYLGPDPWFGAHAPIDGS